MRIFKVIFIFLILVLLNGCAIYDVMSKKSLPTPLPKSEHHSKANGDDVVYFGDKVAKMHVYFRNFNPRTVDEMVSRLSEKAGGAHLRWTWQRNTENNIFIYHVVIKKKFSEKPSGRNISDRKNIYKALEKLSVNLNPDIELIIYYHKYSKYQFKYQQPPKKWAVCHNDKKKDLKNWRVCSEWMSLAKAEILLPKESEKYSLHEWGKSGAWLITSR